MAAHPILLVVPSHGEPRTQVRPQRAIELARHFVATGAIVDVAVLVERPMSVADHARWQRIAPFCRHCWVLSDPSAGRWWQRVAAWLHGRIAREDLKACPAGLAALVRRTDEVTRYRTVILGAARFLPLVDAIGPTARTFVDVRRLPDVAERSSKVLGRDDALESLYPLTTEQLAKYRPGGALFSCFEDAKHFATWKTEVPSLIVPPIADPFIFANEPQGAPSRPARPPRLLFLGSETVANLDGLRWFRRRVLPQVHRLVPSCRLRIVGEAGRHIQAGDDVDRVGWVDALEREYRDAAVVVLPLRVGGKLRRRVIEGLAHHKALALTADAAYGAGLVHRDSAIVSSSEESLAQGIVDVLSHDVLRQRFEKRAAEMARGIFAPESALSAIWPPEDRGPDAADVLEDPEEEAHDEDDASTSV